MLVSDTCDISLALSCLQRGRLDKLIQIGKVNDVTKKVIKTIESLVDMMMIWLFEILLEICFISLFIIKKQGYVFMTFYC